MLKMDCKQVGKLYEAMVQEGFEELELSFPDQSKVRMLVSPLRIMPECLQPGVQLASGLPVPVIVDVLSERVGIFSFGKKSVTVGMKVRKGDHLGFVRGISTQDAILATVDGEIVSVEIKEGDVTEFGRRLYTILPA